MDRMFQQHAVRKLGGHHNAYTPFTLDAGQVAAGEHELLVHISNVNR